MAWWPPFAVCCATLLLVGQPRAEALVIRGTPHPRGKNVSSLAVVSTRHGMRYGVPEMIEAWKDSGKAATCGLSAGTLEGLTQAVTASAYSTQLHQVIDPQASRFIANDGNGNAARIIEKIMSEAGLETHVQKLGHTSSLQQYLTASLFEKLGGNVMGFLKGTDLAHEVVIVACHYDSVNWEDIHAVAPGVDDNGSGTALMLLLAKALAGVRTELRRSVLFVAFNAEEEGLVGSTQFAAGFKTGGEFRTSYGSPVAALVADEVAWPGTGKDARKVIFETKGRSAENALVVDTLAHAAGGAASGNNTTGAALRGATGAAGSDGVDGFVVNYHGFGSDHIPLLDVGIPSVLLIEKDNMYHADNWGHSARDTYQHVDMEFGAALTRVALRAVAALASPAASAAAS